MQLASRVADRIEPTPETLARLKPDAIAELVSRRQLEPEHQSAADELRDVHHALHRSPEQGQSHTGRVSDPLSRMPARIEELWHSRWIPWQRQCGPMLASVTLATVIENQAPVSIHHAHMIARGLTIYCQIAGWRK